ncbi:H-NS histone family protein [Burkholderia cepacia]|uniref:H-NS histone family protein n=1 Tax=Burkholderia cepacia TaxID=292 RepID=UPI0038BD58C9
MIEEIKEKLTQYGLTTADLEPRKKASGKKSSGHVAAKYRSPTGEEWSGRGRAPRWLTAAIEQGKKRRLLYLNSLGLLPNSHPAGWLFFVLRGLSGNPVQTCLRSANISCSQRSASKYPTLSLGWTSSPVKPCGFRSRIERKPFKPMLAVNNLLSSRIEPRVAYIG